MKLSILLCGFALASSGCGDSTTEDAGVTTTDAGHSDAGGFPDAGLTDGGGGDASADDAGGSSMTCTPTAPCAGGAICAGGPGCGATWSCVFSGIACVEDAVEYCGCDGVVFRESSTCPTRPFAYMGPCAGPSGFDCDRSRVSCRAVEPTCPAGYVPEVMDTCWTNRCVPLTECGCADGGQCPEDATCDSGAMRCQAR